MSESDLRRVSGLMLAASMVPLAVVLGAGQAGASPAEPGRIPAQGPAAPPTTVFPTPQFDMGQPPIPLPSALVSLGQSLARIVPPVTVPEPHSAPRITLPKTTPAVMPAAITQPNTTPEVASPNITSGGVRPNTVPASTVPDFTPHVAAPKTVPSMALPNIAAALANIVPPPPIVARPIPLPNIAAALAPSADGAWYQGRPTHIPLVTSLPSTAAGIPDPTTQPVQAFCTYIPADPVRCSATVVDAGVGAAIGAGIAAGLSIPLAIPAAAVGAVAGFVAGIPFLPTGLVVGPLLGAAVGAAVVAGPAAVLGGAIGASIGTIVGITAPLPAKVPLTTAAFTRNRALAPTPR